MLSSSSVFSFIRGNFFKIFISTLFFYNLLWNFNILIFTVFALNVFTLSVFLCITEGKDALSHKIWIINIISFITWSLLFRRSVTWGILFIMFPYIYWALSGLSLLFSWFICLSLCQYHPKSCFQEEQGCNTLFNFSNILAILGPLIFYVNFRGRLSDSMTNLIDQFEENWTIHKHSLFSQLGLPKKFPKMLNKHFEHILLYFL